MRFAWGDKVKLVGADEESSCQQFSCMVCGEEVARGEGETFFVHADQKPNSQCAPLVFRLAIRRLLCITPLIRIPEHAIDLVFQKGGYRTAERLMITEGRNFTPTGATPAYEMGNGVVLDVLYEAGDWRLGVMLHQGNELLPVFKDSDLPDPKMGIIAIDIGKLNLVEGEAVRPWQVQLHGNLAMVVSNKRWLYHPRQKRIGEEWKEREEAKWYFKKHKEEEERDRRLGNETSGIGSAQSYRCACGTVWRGRKGVSSLCPTCKKPSKTFSVPCD